MDVYVFIQTQPGRGAAVMRALVDRGIAVKAGLVTGKWDVIAKVQGIAWPKLASTVYERIHEIGGVVRTYTAAHLPPEIRLFNVIPPVWLFPRVGFEAVVFARIDMADMAQVAAELKKRTGVVGFSIVTGEWDALIQVTGRSFNEIARTIMSINEIRGIQAASTSLVLDSARAPARAAAPKKVKAKAMAKKKRPVKKRTASRAGRSPRRPR